MPNGSYLKGYVTFRCILRKQNLFNRFQCCLKATWPGTASAFLGFQDYPLKSDLWMPSLCSKSHAKSMQHAFGFMVYHTCKLEMPTLNQKEIIQNTISLFNILGVPWEHKPMSFWWRKAIQGKKKKNEMKRN